MLENEENENSENLLVSQPTGEIIFTDTRSDSFHTSDSTEDQIDQDKVIVSLVDLKAEYTNVINILPLSSFVVSS